MAFYFCDGWGSSRGFGMSCRCSGGGVLEPRDYTIVYGLLVGIRMGGVGW